MQRPGKKITRKELKEDQLVTYYFKTRSFLEKHGKTLGFILAGVAVAAIIFGLVINSRIKANIAASYDLFQAQMMFNQGSYQGASDKLNMLIDSYPGTRNAGEAHVALAKAHFRMADYDSTEYYADVFLDDYKSNSILTTAAMAVKAASLEQRGKYLEAAKIFTEAAHKYPRQFTAPIYLLDAGRCCNLAGDNETAIARYVELIENYPDSDLLGRANQQLARAGGIPREIPIKIDLF